MKAYRISMAVVVSLAAGCSLNQPPYSAGIESRLQPSLTAADQEVIELVAVSLIDDSEFLPNAGKSDHYDSIILSDQTAHFPKPWLQALEGKEGRQVPKAAKQSLYHRNSAGVSILDMNPKNSAILIETLNRDRHGGYQLPEHLDGRIPKGIVTLSLPGFSLDGNSAVAVVSYRWAAHGGYGVFFLQRIDGAWRIKSRWFEYYW